MDNKLNRIKEYLKEISAQWETKATTELSYRAALQSLLADLIPGVTVVNEPSHIDCGAPDLLVRSNDATHAPVGYVETKKIDDGDLDGNGKNKEQFSRYKAELDNLVFTDYLDFRFCLGGKKQEGGAKDDGTVEAVRIASVVGGNIIPADDAEIERFAALVDFFGTARPKPITSPARLAALMAGKARLLARAIRETLNKDTEGVSTLTSQMETFRTILIHDLTPEAFADIYAQTITYGMFAARLHDDTPEDFSRAEAAALIPKTNPFMRQLFQYIAIDLDPSVDWIINDLVALFGAVDVEKLMRGYGKQTFRTDPILHFYEDFLAAYDPKLRKSRGVWYTPDPVVNYIVRAVDWILENLFGLPGGLADPSKVTMEFKNEFKKNIHSRGSSIIHKDIHKVQLLDPAAGTGTFIAASVRCIYDKVVKTMGKGAWQGYVTENLLPRLNGFEILMASYAMAHLKLDMLLAETGYVHKTEDRLRIFLTNSLEPHDKETGTLFAAALAKEANEANFIKRDCPVMVVVGNPPYSGVSKNNGEWATHLIDDYKKEPNSDQPLKERKSWINDDYVKFLRLAQRYVEKNGEGVVAYINNNGFLGNPTFRGMRWNLLKSFDEIYILNLHGDLQEEEVGPDGSKGENVFDITKGVSINIFIKKASSSAKGSAAKNGVKLATVHYADLKGSRKNKYDFLEKNGIESVKWQTLLIQEPYYLFLPKDLTPQGDYAGGFSIADIALVQSMGSVSANDALNISFTEAEQQGKINDLLTLPETSWRQKTGREKDSRDWTYATARADADKHSDSIRKIAYRPFDDRYTCYTGNSRGLYSSPQQKVMSQFMRGENIGLCAIRICARDDSLPVFVTDKITDKTILSSKDNANIFPLYLYTENMGVVEKVPNINQAIYKKICETAGNVSPEGVFGYIYGVMHTPSYREKYRDFLKLDFPRIPYPKSAEEFNRISEIGSKLVQVHLLKDPNISNPFANPYAKFEGDGKCDVEKVGFDNNRVYINGDQYFDNVPESAWNAYIGGYQPAQKWLKDRKGRTLTNDDIAHYKSIVYALLESAKLIAAL